MPIHDYSSADGNYTWLDIVSPTAAELLEISRKYHLHEYTLRDCLEPDHLPKHEELGNIDFIITRMLVANPAVKLLSMQELSTKVALFYNKDLLITIHRMPHAFLEEMKGKCIDNGRCQTTGALVTRILWHVLHSYDKPSITLSDEVDRYENRIFLRTATPAILEELYYIRRKASICKKLLVFTGEVINATRTTDNDQVAQQDTKDLYLKLITIYGQVYEDVTNLLNIYLSLSAQKTNEVMKVLTIFSVFFMPLTFIAGIYGMNFKFMPELEQRWGYYIALLSMAVIAAIIFIWFKRKKWL
ncbi:MAG: magnesium transporter CorA [Taibaiella sp.]|nr:magnesium transporter CorA [Taibaiella sp.]